MKQSVRSTHCLLFISCTLTVQTPSGALGLLPNQTLAIATSRNCDFLRRWKLIGACFLPAMAMFVFYPLKDMFATEKKTKNFPYCVRLSENIKFWQPGIGLKDFNGEDDAKEEKAARAMSKLCNATWLLRQPRNSRAKCYCRER